MSRLCDACGRFRSDDEAGTPCKCGDTEVMKTHHATPNRWGHGPRCGRGHMLSPYTGQVTCLTCLEMLRRDSMYREQLLATMIADERERRNR